MLMQTIRGWSRPHDRATTVIHAALSNFEASTGLVPLVILLPRRVFDQYAREQDILASVIPDGPEVMGGREWAEVRIVEHESLEEIEVY